MQKNEVYENFLYVAALVAGCCTAVPLRLNELRFEGQCFLYAELDVLRNNVVMGDERYCTFAFISSIVNASLAALFGFVKFFCIVRTDSLSLVQIYFGLFTCIVSAFAWINSLVCTIIFVTGFTEWCNSLENNQNVGSCKDAEKWDWTQYKPAGIDGSKFYTFLFMAEIALYCAVGIWFIIVLLSGNNFRQSMLRSRAEYWFQDNAIQYPLPAYNLPAHQVQGVPPYM